MEKPDPLVELYAVGFLIDAAAQCLDFEEAETLRASVVAALREPLQLALNNALAQYLTKRDATGSSPALGMAGESSQVRFKKAPGGDPMIRFNCVARCPVPGCSHEVLVINDAYLDECQCKNKQHGHLLELHWAGPVNRRRP